MSTGVLAKMDRQYYATRRQGTKRKRATFSNRPAGTYKKKRINGRTGGDEGRELKNNDRFLDDVTISESSTWTNCDVDPVTFLCLNSMAQGTAADQRLGRKITCKSIQIGGTVEYSGATGISLPVPAGSVMLALVLDTQTNLVQMPSTDVYEAANLLTAVCNPLRKLENTTRYKVLKKIVVDFPAQPLVSNSSDNTTFIAGAQQARFQMNVKLNDLLVTFKTGAGADVTDIQDNSLHLIANRNQVGQACNLSYISRLRFVG